MPDESSLLGGADTHIPALDGDAGQPDETVEEVQDEVSAGGDDTAGDESDAGAEEGDGGQEETGEESAEVVEGDDLLAQFAKRTGLDPNDPGQRKTLNTLVAKEKYIRELQAKLDGTQAGKPAASGLTKFEQEQQAAQDKAQQEAAAATPASGGEKGPAIGQYDDIGTQWQSPRDAYSALSEAWGEAAASGDYGKVVATEAAIFARRFDNIGVPRVEQLVQQRLDKFMQDNFGSIMPVIQQQAAHHSATEAQEFAMGELEATPEYKDIRSLDQEQEGPPLVVNGEKFRNTPLNRILVENPWIMSIKREHADPKVADRLTYLARLKAAHKIGTSGQISSQKAKALINAGSKQEQRKSQDRVRQSLNSGGTPGKTLETGKPKPLGYVEDLIGSTDGPISFSDL